ncbi:MAG: ATP-binding protein [Fusobacterium sp.]|jgi:signal transduction histidine kinase|uniref:ATP-binding protein n=1 Tax=Fusobacterium sp. TaxID=68766 RepID=UPI003992123D
MELKYEIEDKIIAELLGIQNFTNKESAILELIKNSYDAGASKVEIIYNDNEIIIIDNGKGMSENNIKENWMYVGKSNKKEKYAFKDRNGENRIYSGSKGVGRFALARLGEKIKVISYNGNDSPIVWTTDWEQTILEKLKNYNTIGTKIIITELRDIWGENGIEKLVDFLSRVYKNQLMKIIVVFNNKNYEVYNHFNKPKAGVNYLSKISFKYISTEKKISCQIHSDEFTEEALNYYNGNINNYEVIIDLLREKRLLFDEKVYEELGDFKGELFFKILSNEIEVERFCYKHLKISEPYKNGVILYRNDFSISSYDGTKDWIGLGKRARKSPAAATHPTGNWRVKENNLSGKIEIDRKINYMLKDLSNRQGIEENEHYEVFIDIIHKVISVFEDYRQGIIRAINVKNMEYLNEIDKFETIKEILRNPIMIHSLEAKSKDKLVVELKDLINLKEEYKLRYEEADKNFKYNEKILNVFSTLGLKVSSIAHDIKNDRNNLVNIANYIEKALKKHKVWEILDKDENKKISSLNVPKLLDDTKKYSKKVNILMNGILKNIRKSQFEIKELNIYEVLNEIKEDWMEDYGVLNINLDIDKNIIFNSSEDTFKVIFDNLILNSYQQNLNLEMLNINIKITENEANELLIIYEDSGKGLDEKYLDNPNKILIPHETTRKDGHGLGMWIVNNTVLKTEGHIKKIGISNIDSINKGFYFEFIIRGE